MNYYTTKVVRSSEWNEFSNTFEAEMVVHTTATVTIEYIA